MPCKAVCMLRTGSCEHGTACNGDEAGAIGWEVVTVWKGRDGERGSKEKQIRPLLTYLAP